MRPDRCRRTAPLAVALLLLGCVQTDTELQRTYDYMDSLRVYLGELRLMDHRLGKVVTADSLDASLIVPLIRDRYQPTVADLRQRLAAMPTSAAVDTVHGMFLHYLDTRLAAYDAALRGYDEARPELYEEFARKQIEAQALGDDLEDTIQALRSRVPGFD